MRAEYGADILAKKALEQIKKEQLDRVVIDGIRNINEVETLCTNPDFLLLAIVADRSVRFERLQKNPRREKLDAKLFAELDYRDVGIGEKDTGLQVALCIALADVFIENNSTRHAFEKRLAKYLEGKVA
jgi:dephospho-CoA kinase